MAVPYFFAISIDFMKMVEIILALESVTLETEYDSNCSRTWLNKDEEVTCKLTIELGRILFQSLTMEKIYFFCNRYLHPLTIWSYMFFASF